MMAQTCMQSLVHLEEHLSNYLIDSIDLYAEPGTPLYAMCDGTISRSERYVTEQPVRDKDGNYPPGYSGDDNDAGNRFTLEGIVNGKKSNTPTGI